MFARNKRVLWLLNHRTLMPYEAQLLVRLGFEVFTPKVMPKSVSFRSGAVDFSYDSSLTIPVRALARLNEFDFYETEWPKDIVAIVNRYFGTVYTIPYGVQVQEVVQKFEGQIMFRVFGMSNSETYRMALCHMYGSDILSQIHALGDRFWFAQAYEQLAECEPSLLADRAIFLPIGVPETLWTTANSYTGSDKRILFFCSNCITIPYYADVYRKFKEDFGDLPHVIIGAQDVPVDDPSVLGFVSDDELRRLYRECAVMYYHSTELRHVHYAPIEAAINGMPIVYYADSLLGRMTPEITHGRSASREEARASIERILSGDSQFIQDVATSQRALAHQFSDEYCRTQWEENLAGSGYLAAVQDERPIAVLLREARRVVLMPISRGLSSLPPWAPTVLASADGDGLGSILEGGIDFTELDYPLFVREVAGLSFPEDHGRWSIGPTITIVLREELPRRFRLTLEGGAYGPNIGASVRIDIGTESKNFAFNGEPGECEPVVLEFKMRRPATQISILIPNPIIPAMDNRSLGLALAKMSVEITET